MPQTTQAADPLQKLVPAILLTGLVAGTLDGLAAIVQYLLSGKTNPEIIFKYIASGVFGNKAYSSGPVMIVWGVLFHFMIAYGLTVFYFWLYPGIKWLGENVILSGVLYGLFAWVITTQVIVRLSRITPGHFHLDKALIAMGILVLCIGLPISLMANKHYLYKK